MEFRLVVSEMKRVKRYDLSIMWSYYVLRERNAQNSKNCNSNCL